MTNSPADRMSTLYSLADHASLQNDRWLFVALLIVVLAGAVIAFRWLTAQNSKSFDTWRDDMKLMQTQNATLHGDRLLASERYSEELRSIVRSQTEETKLMMREHATVLAKNAEVMASVNATLREMQHQYLISSDGGQRRQAAQ